MSMPKQLNKEELSEIIQKFVSTMEQKKTKMIGQMMAFMKNNYEGQYDSKSLSEIAKKVII